MAKIILGLSGSLRQGSFNAVFLRAAAERTPPGARIGIGTIRDVPLYDADLEAAEGLPRPSSAFRRSLARRTGSCW